MEFYLVRHGEAVSETVDPKRPLSEAGRQQVESVAHLLAARNPKLSCIVHSGILRAKQTAEILAAGLGSTVALRQISGLLPDDDPFIAKAQLETADSSLMLVGHLPHMNRLAALLVHGDVNRQAVDFGPATVACVCCGIPRWKIVWIIRPEPL
jgi:phosphohistidine phosphatase